MSEKWSQRVMVTQLKETVPKANKIFTFFGFGRLESQKL
jgi:hypothetical protein